MSLEAITGRCPSPGDDAEAAIAACWARAGWTGPLDACPQDPVYHQEGDVGVHTRLVAGALCADPRWAARAPAERELLYASALLHDLGKPLTTRLEPDTSPPRYSSRGHPLVGARLARRLLCAEAVPVALREQVCALIEHHLLPFTLPTRGEDSTRRLLRLRLSVDLELLALLAQADARGRRSPLQGDLLASVELFHELATELPPVADCFPDGWSRFRYFRDASRAPTAAVYDESRNEVLLLSGLPGSGKSTWARALDLPRIELDALRAELGVSPKDNQGAVVARARELAKEHLRAGRGFLWDGTNLSRDLRAQVIELCDAYGARVHLVVCEAPLAVCEARNAARARPVPAAALERMLRRWDFPDLAEAWRVTVVETG